MNRTAQSTFAYVALGMIALLAILNAAQLHNLESRVGEINQKLDALTRDGVKTSGIATGGAATSGVATGAAPGDQRGVCKVSAEEQADLDKPGNLLKPRRMPKDWPTTIASGGTLRRQVASDPPGLNLLASNNAADIAEYYKYASDRLAERDLDEPARWNASLATYVTTEDDGLSFTVRIRKGVKWHKPAVDLSLPKYAWLKADHELTADDFVFAWETIQNPQVGGRAAAARGGLDHLDHAEKIDDYTFKVVFKERLYTNFSNVVDSEPFPRWLYMYDENGKPFDKATWGEKLNSHWYNQKAIGVGPYRFLSWESGVKLAFARDADYWNDCLKPTFDKLEFSFIKDQAAWLSYLKTGQLDYTQMQPQQFISEVKPSLNEQGQPVKPLLGQEHLKLIYHEELSWFYIGWNLRLPMFEDVRVRKAMTMALDRQSLVKNVFAGLGQVTSGPFAIQNECYDKSVLPMPYDLREAMKLLEEAGWVDSDGNGVREKMIDGKKKEFVFTLMIYGGSNEYDTLASAYREALLTIGIKMNVEAPEWSAMLKKLDSLEFDAYTGAWAPGIDTDLRPVWHSSQVEVPQSSNRIGFKNARADEIIEAHRRELDHDKRIALCQEFHRLVAEEQPYTFFYQRRRAMLYWDYLNTPLFTVENPYRDIRYFSFASARP